MNKDEIKKALECCTDDMRNGCGDCPYKKQGKTYLCKNNRMLNDVLNLITEQEKEIELLKMQMKDVVNHADTFLAEEQKFEAENVKLKAENEQLKDVVNRLKQVIHDDVFDQLCPDCAKAGASVLEQIDDIIKEIEKCLKLQ